jgi:hypothetical protein
VLLGRQPQVNLWLVRVVVTEGAVRSGGSVHLLHHSPDALCLRHNRHLGQHHAAPGERRGAELGQLDGSSITASAGMITATGTSSRLAISTGVTSTGGGVKSARVAVTAPAAGAGSTADTPFTWPTAFASAGLYGHLDGHHQSGNRERELGRLQPDGFRIHHQDDQHLGGRSITCHVIAGVIGLGRP